MTDDKQKWTAGPWTATETIRAHDGFPACWQIDAEYHAVCTTQFCYSQETEANARLIAASPDMAEAIAEALSHCGKDGYLDCGKPATDKLRAALAKAGVS